MVKNNSHINELLAGYFLGNLTAEQTGEINEWIAASEENRRYLMSMRDIWFSSLAADTSRYDSEKAYGRFLNRQTAADGKTKTPRVKRLAWQIAAAVATLFLISYISFKQGSRHFENALTDIVIETPWGATTKTFLPDGTLVWLNAGSKITCSQGFGIKERNIKLSGEGYFEVAQNERLPFNVLTDEMSVRALGTKFNVRNYSDDDEAEIDLLEGKVRINNLINKGENVNINPDRRLLMDKKSGKMFVSKINANNTIEWINGYVFFDEELLGDIAKKLERSYNVKIIMETPELKQLRFYGNFIRKKQSITDILDALASTGKMKYKIQNNEIVISP
jgi:ferric-dicitrate binding protein FerR (iron transport regulator)